MKKFSKVLALILALAMIVSAFAACSKAPAADEQTPATDAPQQDATTPAEGETAPAEDGVIVFGTNAEFPPFEFVAAEGVIGEFDGIDIAIADLIAKDNGMTAEISNMEFDSLLIALQNGQIDAVIAGMTVTAERQESVNFTTPYYQATQVMIVKEGSDITKAADMADKRIAVIQGYTGEICVNDMGFEYTSFKKGTDAVMELMNGKADVVVIDSATAGKYVADNEGLAIVEDAEAFASEEYAIAVAKGNDELLAKINASIEELLAAGTVAELSDKYSVAE